SLISAPSRPNFPFVPERLEFSSYFPQEVWASIALATPRAAKLARQRFFPATGTAEPSPATAGVAHIPIIINSSSLCIVRKCTVFVSASALPSQSHLFPRNSD